MTPEFGAEYEARNEAAAEERAESGRDFSRYEIRRWLERLLEKNTRRLAYCKDRCDSLAFAMMTGEAKKDIGERYMESLRVELNDKRNLTGELKGNIAGLKYALKSMDKLEGV